MKKVLLALLVLGVLAGVAVGGGYWLRGRRVTAFAETPLPLSAPVTVEIPRTVAAY